MYVLMKNSATIVPCVIGIAVVAGDLIGLLGIILKKRKSQVDWYCWEHTCYKLKSTFSSVTHVLNLITVTKSG